MTGDEAEVATVAAVDAAVLAEQPFLRIIHGMGTGVVRERVQRVVSKDRRVSPVRIRPAQPGWYRCHHRRVLRVSMIPDETIEQVRDSTDIVGLIGESVTLKRTGSDYRGPCPFHGGTNRNFAVIPKKGRYYCFVCHESGDVFSWFMKRHGDGLPDRGPRGGTPHRNRHSRAGRTRRSRSPRAALQRGGGGRTTGSPDSCSSCPRPAPLGSTSRAVTSRSKPPPCWASATPRWGRRSSRRWPIWEWKSGFCWRPAWRRSAMMARSAPASGGRLLFPIHNLRGRVVGLGGRLLGPGEPKYLNSPETEIFHKGKQLYNLHQAKGRSGRKSRSCWSRDTSTSSGSHSPASSTSWRRWAPPSHRIRRRCSSGSRPQPPFSTTATCRAAGHLSRG